MPIKRPIKRKPQSTPTLIYLIDLLNNRHAMSKILVLGATGVIGKVLVDALLNAREQFEAIGIFTSPSTVESKKDLVDSFTSRGAVIHTGDLYKDEDVLNVYKGESGP